MIICLCFNITKEEYLKEDSLAGEGCGLCIPELQRIKNEEINDTYSLDTIYDFNLL